MPRSSSPCSCYVLNNRQPRTARTLHLAPEITTIDPATERAERQLRLCQELADLGMQLARAAAVQALADLAPKPAPEPAPKPDAAEPSAPPARVADPAVLFTRLARAVRQALLLESRIAAELQQARAAAKPAPHDLRRPALRRALHEAATTQPNPSQFRQDAYERLDDELARDQQATSADLLATICETLGVELDAARLPKDMAYLIWPSLKSRPVQPPDESPLQTLATLQRDLEAARRS